MTFCLSVSEFSHISYNKGKILLFSCNFLFRTQDIKTKKQHIPLVDRTPLEPPPIVIAIVGPPKVGKSTLLQCIVKNFTKQRLANVQGPVTVVSGKEFIPLQCEYKINTKVYRSMGIKFSYAFFDTLNWFFHRKNTETDSDGM